MGRPSQRNINLWNILLTVCIDKVDSLIIFRSAKPLINTSHKADAKLINMVYIGGTLKTIVQEEATQAQTKVDNYSMLTYKDCKT